MVADVDLDSANKVAAEINAAGGEAATVKVDMTKEAECQAMVKTTLAKFGQIDILCNVAGGSMGRFIRDNLTPFHQQDKSEWDRIMDVNLNGARNCTRAVVNHMMERKTGKIVSFSSIAAVNGMRNGADYAAAKAGIVGLTKSLALELQAYNIQVNCVTPSATLTERIKTYMVAQRQGQPNRPQMDLAQFAAPEDLAAAVLFLVSPNADHVSGQNIIFGVPPRQP